MTKTSQLPHYTIEELKTLDNNALIDTMINDEDRVPRLLIDECVQRNESLLKDISLHINKNQPPETDGEWWLQLHFIMILGLIPSEQAGILLIECIDTMRTSEDENLQEWFASCWPALMENKPQTIIEQVLIRCNDKTMPWFLRTNLSDIIIANALRMGEEELEKAIDWLAKMVSDEENDWSYRLTTGNNLLDFPRDRHLQLLTKLAKQQTGLGVHFNQKDINSVYQKGLDSPSWLRFNNPWDFYEPNKIEERQRRWQQEDNPKDQADPVFEHNNFFSQEITPYQHTTPKIGRNDPCSCGSGKKYKKCCLN